MPGSTVGKIVVQKFGGTSVAESAARIRLAERVRERLAEGVSVVVVVSAMGRSGDPYATDTLLGLVSHFDPDARESDKLAACGEIISAVVVARTLEAHGIPSRSFSGVEAGILTDGSHGDSAIVSVEPTALLDALRAGVTPVVAGFQGMGPDGTLTTLGRGGSDTTACALGVALGAETVEILTDVDGVMTADPSITERAHLLDAIGYEEAFQMARHGSRIVHAPAAEIAMDAGIPIRVCSTFSGATGTLVTDAETLRSIGVQRVATAISHVDHIARFTVALPPDDEDGGHMRAQTRIYRSMADADVSLDMFTPCGDELVFSTQESDVPHTVGVLDAIALPYTMETGLAKVTLVGAGMHGVPGVMARLAEALDAVGVTIRQVADSHATISLLVCQNMRDQAVEAIHDAFHMGEAVR